MLNNPVNASDPENIINGGDSGSGAYINGELVGNIWSYYQIEGTKERLGLVDVALLPPGTK